MVALLCFVVAILASPLTARRRLEAENAALRHQLNILCRQRHVRVRLTNNDRWFFIQLYRWVPSILNVLTVVRPETLVAASLYRLLQQDQKHTDHWTKMPQRFARFSGSGPSHHTRSLVGFIIITFGFRFSVHTGVRRSNVRL